MTLFDAYGSEIRAGRPVLDEIGLGPVRQRHSSYPSQGLTPERLASIFREADWGDIERQAELFEEMEEKDAHLASVLQTRKLAVAGLDHEVAPASEGREDEAVAAFVREAIEAMDNWEEAVADLLDAVARGFAVSEIMWELSGGKVRIRELKQRHQKMFTFLSRDGVLEAPRLLTDAEPARGEELIPNKFVVHLCRGRSGAAPRAGLLRPCAYMYLFKNYAIKDWVIFNERFAMPMRVGKFGPGASEADLSTLRSAVFNLGADAAAVISDSTVIELLEAQGRSASAEIYEKLVEFCDRSVSKAVLGHTGSAESTPGRLGSEREARDVRRDLLEADSRALARTIRAQVIRPLVEFNFGPGAGLPLFRFVHEEDADLRALADTYAALVRDVGFEGMPVSHVHRRFGIPVAAEGEETIRKGGRDEG